MYSDVSNSLLESKNAPPKKRSVVYAAQILAVIIHPSIHPLTSCSFSFQRFLSDYLFFFTLTVTFARVCFDHGYIKVPNSHESKSTNIKDWGVIQELLDLVIKSTSVTHSCI